MLHLVNGDSTRVTLEKAGVPGTVVVWADALYDGPVPHIQIGDAGFRGIRESHWITAMGGPAFPHDGPSLLTQWDEALAQWPQHEEVVIWCEHDLFDQLLLIRHLAWFSRQSLGSTRLSLICIGAYPGKPNFLGLGELTSMELAELLPTRVPVTSEQLSLGARAFDALTDETPTALVHVAFDDDTSALPFLAVALQRLLGEFPAVGTGMTQTEALVLEQLRASKGMTVIELIRALHRVDRVFVMTDTRMRDVLARLSSEPALITLGPTLPDEWARTVTITPLGESVLDGDHDVGDLLGFDRWIGGVLIGEGEPDWRRDGFGRVGARV